MSETDATRHMAPATAPPRHVREAPSHPDPYPYYAALAARPGLIRDEANGWWVAADAPAAFAVFESRICHTRPQAGRVPEALLGGPMADIFARMVRLRDDAEGAAIKRAVKAALAGLDLADVANRARTRADKLDRALGLPYSAASLTAFMSAYPVHVMGELIGLAPHEIEALPSWLSAYGLAAAAAATQIPVPTDATIAAGHEAAAALSAGMDALIDDRRRHGPLLVAFAREAQLAGIEDRADIRANAIGLLVQTAPAVGALIGATLLALVRHPQARSMVERDRAALAHVVQEVLRFDPSTSSTYRVVVEDGSVAGTEVKAGDVIIVLIAAASRDAMLNAEPSRFEPLRPDRKYFEFGVGRHACPASRLAPLIAEIGVDHLLTRGVPLEALAGRVHYPPSPHIRAPRFD